MRAAVILVAALVLGTGARAETGVVAVTVTGVRSNAGHVLVAICDRATFLQTSCLYHGRVAASPGALTVRISGVPPGTYAAQAYQDANDNGRIDRDFFGRPTEGIGFSNNAVMRFGPPAFDDAAFTLTATGGEITLALRYYD